MTDLKIAIGFRKNL